uniref:SID1 transmembrane family member 2 n=1 Tax=Eptatretus burgeri TaxID=7764 RepID=A0A8C4PZZ4_EPTBU
MLVITTTFLTTRAPSPFLQTMWKSPHKHVRLVGIPAVMFLLFLCFGIRAGSAPLVPSDLTAANFNTLYTGSVQADRSKEYLFHYRPNKSEAVRVWVASTTNDSKLPLMFVVQQQQGVMSWQVPLVLRAITGILYLYRDVSRTLCSLDVENSTSKLALKSPSQLHPMAAHATLEEKHFTVAVTTQSPNNVSYELRVTENSHLLLRSGVKYVFNATPSQPQFFLYEFASDEKSVMVNVTSRIEDPCSVVSVQDFGCPVNDLDQNVNFAGTYQTMTSQAAITVQRTQQNSRFHLVFVVKTDDYACKGILPLTPINLQEVVDTDHRVKELEVEITKTISHKVYMYAIVFCCTLFLPFYLVAFVWMCIRQWRTRPQRQLDLCNVEEQKKLSEDDSIPSSLSGDSYGAIVSCLGHVGAEGPELKARRLRVDWRHTSISSSDEDELEDYDTMDDALSDKNIIRSKPCLHVADLARRKHSAMTKKYQIYCWNLVTVGVFYVLPVIQLVLTYQSVVHDTGNQDICYYNFLCANPLGQLTSFNNVFSNLGYFLLGLLFLLTVAFREFSNQMSPQTKGTHSQHELGLPKHYGLFYAMGFALIMEGLLSACYHVCPNYSNFQFDTAFMYIIAGLCMLKLYQKRHSDVNANAYKAYASFAVIIFFAVLGVVVAKKAVWFWVLCTLVHILASLALSFHIYHVGHWHFSIAIFKHIAIVFYNDCIRRCTRPLHMDRLILLVIGNIFNWSYAIVGFGIRPRDFDSYLLGIFMSNLLLYSAFYIIMKIRSGERILPVPMLFIILAMVAWGAALYFFFQGLTSWEETAAKSRERNKPCILLQFFDHHDIWHFLSSIAMFLSFLVLLTLDDDVDLVRRDKILVF